MVSACDVMFLFIVMLFFLMVIIFSGAKVLLFSGLTNLKMRRRCAKNVRNVALSLFLKLFMTNFAAPNRKYDQ